MYEYACEVLRLVDGDTVDVSVDLGFNVHLHERFRLKGINAPEMRGPDRELGKEATAYLQRLIDEGVEDGMALMVRTEKMKKGKYGRWIATLVLRHPTDPLNNVDLNQQMVKDGYALAVEY